MNIEEIAMTILAAPLRANFVLSSNQCLPAWQHGSNAANDKFLSNQGGQQSQFCHGYKYLFSHFWCPNHVFFISPHLSGQLHFICNYILLQHRMHSACTYIYIIKQLAERNLPSKYLSSFKVNAVVFEISLPLFSD